MASTETPLMRQYLELKKSNQDALMFFRLGDFYELFFLDATTAAKELEITLTTRNKNDPNPIPMCGVPFHSATGYINKLVSRGYKVAICEQFEEQKVGSKTIVRRDVVRVVSPGTQLDPEALTAKAPNNTHAACKVAGTEKIEWATCDFTTGKFTFGISANFDKWIETLQSQSISEVLIPLTESGETLLDSFKAILPSTFAQLVPSFYFEENYALDRIREQFDTQNADAVHPELKKQPHAVGALIKYFQDSQKTPKIPSVTKIDLWGFDGRMELDPATVRALELLPNRNASGKDVSMLTWLDRTKTAMGGRLLRDWLTRPLTNVAAIEKRHAEVELLIANETYRALEPKLSEIYDLERLISRISLMMANARDLRALAHSITHSEKLTSLLPGKMASELEQACTNDLLALASKAQHALVETPPFSVREAGMFAKGYNETLDELIELTTNGEAWLAEFEARERQATGISSLKVRYTRVFGYYIEITKANLANTPEHYIRKQTIAGGERFITEELKSFEEKILTAEKKRQDLEYSIFKDLCQEFTAHARAITEVSRAVAHVDCITSFANLAATENYVRPEMNEGKAIAITAGVHPTVAGMMKLADGSALSKFVANDTEFSADKNFLLITGPNMGGKSTVMRQTALIVLMAQMGSFVPAKKASIGVTDRIFTRIGAADNIAEGSSTFMVEMSEMSYIIRNATDRSLILLDEIGRGTSTFDGMSLAWALASDIAGRVQARTMFATHYHELTDLESKHSNVVNYHMAAQINSARNDGSRATVKFLYKLQSGQAEHSYGIMVARLAGLPEAILADAQVMLEKLESQSSHSQLDLFGSKPAKAKKAPEVKIVVQKQPSEIEELVKAVDINNLTPIQALSELARLKEKAFHA